MAIARVKAKQALLAQAEADARRALLGVLKHQGKYNPQTPRFIVGLASILVEQGRYEEAEKLMRSALEVQRAQGIGDDTPASANILSQLGGVLVLQRKTKEAARVYAELENAIAQWEPRRREFLLLNESRIAALYTFRPARGRDRRGPGTHQTPKRAYGRQPYRHRFRARDASRRIYPGRPRR